MPQRIVLYLLLLAGLILATPSGISTKKPAVPPGHSPLKTENIYKDNDYTFIKTVHPGPGGIGDKIIVDKKNNMLYLFKDGDLSRSYRVATGEKPEYTPEGSFFIVNKSFIPPGTGNDRFGPRWMGLGIPSHCDLRAEKPDERAPRGIKYGIHGTDEPQTIGTHASAGCIRLLNSDIIDLFNRVEVGTPVDIVR